MAARKAGMDTGVEVARISVKVHPNTKDFREELRRQLKGMDDDAAVDVSPDEQKSVKGTKRTVKKVKKELDGVGKIKVKPGSLVEEINKLEKSRGLSALEKSAEKIRASLGEDGKPNLLNLGWDKKTKNLLLKTPAFQGGRDIRFDQRVDRFLDQLKREESAAREAKERERIAQARQDEADAAERLKKTLSDNRFQWAPDAEDLRVKANDFAYQLKYAQDANRRLSEALRSDGSDNAVAWWDPRSIKRAGRAFFNKPIDIPLRLVDEQGNPVDPNQKEGKRSLFGFITGGRKGGNVPKGTDPNSIPLPKFGSGLNASAWALIAGGVLVYGAPVIGAITTALLAIPAVIGLIGGAIGAITLGLDGFKKAAATISEPFENLKKTISDANETAFTPFFQAIAEKIFPSLEKTLPAVSEGLAAAAQGITDAFSDPTNVGRFENSMQNLGAFFEQIRPGVNDFTSGLIQLIDEFSKVLPDFGDWFNGAGASFKNWIAELSEGGGLQQAFRNLGTVIKSVLDALGQWGTTSMDFFQQAHGADTLANSLRGIGNAINDIIQFSASLNNMFKTLEKGLLIMRAPWRLIRGDFSGAFSDVKDLLGFGGSEADGGMFAGVADSLQNMPVDARTGGLPEAEAQVARLNKALENTQFKANQAQTELSKVLGGPAPAPIQGPGFNNDYPLGGGATGAAAAAEERPKVPVPDATEAIAAINDYQTKAQETSDKVKEALETASTVKPPDLGNFAAEFDKLPQAATKAMQNVVNAITDSSSAVSTAAQGVGNAAGQALMGTVEMFSGIGVQMMMGLAGGIKAGSAAVITAAVQAAVAAKTAAEGALGIKSPSKVFAKIGDQTMQGFKVGMEDGVQPVIDQAKALAWRISEAFADGSDPTAALSGLDGKQVSAVEKALGFEAKRLAYQARALEYQSKVTGDTSLKDQAEAIKLKREEIMLQKDMIDLTQEYADLNGQGSGSNWLGDSMKQAGTDLFGMPFDFAGATTNQFMSDLGMSGNGAVGALMDYGMQFGKSAVGSVFNFNVSNADEAIAIKNNQINKEALGVVGR